MGQFAEASVSYELTGIYGILTRDRAAYPGHLLVVLAKAHKVNPASVEMLQAIWGDVSRDMVQWLSARIEKVTDDTNHFSSLVEESRSVISSAIIKRMSEYSGNQNYYRMFGFSNGYNLEKATADVTKLFELYLARQDKLAARPIANFIDGPDINLGNKTALSGMYLDRFIDSVSIMGEMLSGVILDFVGGKFNGRNRSDALDLEISFNELISYVRRHPDAQISEDAIESLAGFWNLATISPVNKISKNENPSYHKLFIGLLRDGFQFRAAIDGYAAITQVETENGDFKDGYASTPKFEKSCNVMLQAAIKRIEGMDWVDIKWIRNSCFALPRADDIPSQMERQLVLSHIENCLNRAILGDPINAEQAVKLSDNPHVRVR